MKNGIHYVEVLSLKKFGMWMGNMIINQKIP
jgi:hypothetical protein